MKNSVIYKELVGILDLEIKDIESLGAKEYAELVEKVSGSEDEKGNSLGGVSDDVWFKLSEPTRLWVEEGTKALSIKEDVSTFPDILEDERPERVRARTQSQAPKEAVPPVLDVEDMQEKKKYKIEYTAGDGMQSYEGTVLEVTRRSIILSQGGVECVIHKRDVQRVVLLEDIKSSKDLRDVQDVTKAESTPGKSLLVCDALEGAKYSIYSEDDPKVLVPTTCVRVTSARGVFDEEDGTRHRLDLDVTIQSASISEVVREPDATDNGSEKRSDVAKSEVKVEKEKKKTVTVGLRIRELVCEDSQMTVEEIKDALEREDRKCSDTTLSGVYKDTQTILGILFSLGKLK